jgi:uncharacterized DUF497 family protein
MDFRFEWDAAKAGRNLLRHGVHFRDAVTAFADPLSITIGDPAHSEREERLLLLGRAASGRLLVVVHTERGGVIRIISARPASRRESRKHEQEPEW